MDLSQCRKVADNKQSVSYIFNNSVFKKIELKIYWDEEAWKLSVRAFVNDVANAYYSYFLTYPKKSTFSQETLVKICKTIEKLSDSISSSIKKETFKQNGDQELVNILKKNFANVAPEKMTTLSESIKLFYNTIMKSVAKTVKKALNESV